MSATGIHQCYHPDSWLVQEHSMSPQALLKECHQGVLDLHSALAQLDSAGTHLTECLAFALHNTSFRCVANVLMERLSAVFSLALSQTSVSILKEMEAMLLEILNSDQHVSQQPSYGQNLCHISLLLTKLKKQYFTLCHSKMADLVHSLLCLKGEDQASGEVTKLVLKLGLADGQDLPNKPNASLPNTPWGSPKTRKVTRPEATKNLSKTGFRPTSSFDRNANKERKGSFYSRVDEGWLETKEQLMAVPLTSQNNQDYSLANQMVNSDPFFDSHFGKELNHIKRSADDNFMEPESSLSKGLKPQLASEEELQSVINLLSGMGCGSASPMQVIPEIPAPQDPMRLTVPQICCMPSTSSDTQLEELRTQKSQVHRRSEGCLDLSSVNRNLWPHQQHHYHRASLPSVQIFSASGHRSGFETPSPIPSYACDSPSSNYSRDPPSPGYFRSDPPSPFRTHYANSLGVGLGLGSNMLLPMQWAPGSSGMGGGQINNDLDMCRSKTWSACAGISPMSAGSGIQDASDLSDDSSTEDQFFAVGRDMTNVIYSKEASSDDETGHGQHGMSKNGVSWQSGYAHRSTGSIRGLALDLLEPPDLYNTHRPIQMQWSDPLSSRTMWSGTPSQDLSQQKTSQSMQGFGGTQ